MQAASEQWNADRERRLTLALLWVWVLFNYVYGDIFHIFTILMNPTLQLQLESGMIGGIPLNQMTLFWMAIGMELSIMMVFLSWKLPRRLNRPLNIAAGLLFTFVMGAVVFGSGRLPRLTGYTLYGVIEMATTLAILGYAWRWRRPSRLADDILAPATPAASDGISRG